MTLASRFLSNRAMLFEQAHIEAIARALADEGLTGTEVGHLLRYAK